jgi:hypothetical protein
MPVDPTGPLSLPLANLRTMVADCAAFQDWVEAANATEALDSIFLVGLPAPLNGHEYTRAELEGLRPCCVIDFFDPSGRGMRQITQNSLAIATFAESGMLALDFLDDVAPADAQGGFEDAKLRFMNNAGGVLEHLQELSGQGGYMHLHQVEIALGPRRTSIEGQATRGDAWLLRLAITWGL